MIHSWTLFQTLCYIAVATLLRPSGVNSQIPCDSWTEKVATCWLDYYDVPICTGRDYLVDCAWDGLTNAKSCDGETQNEIDEMYKAFKTIKSTLCDNSELYNGFVNRRACWAMARNCALPLANLSVKNATKVLCRDTVRAMMVCSYHSFMCKELQDNYTRAIFKSSACKAFESDILDDHSQHLAKGNTAVARHSLIQPITLVFMTTAVALLKPGVAR